MEKSSDQSAGGGWCSCGGGASKRAKPNSALAVKQNHIQDPYSISVGGSGLPHTGGGLSSAGPRIVEAKVVLLGDSGVGKSSIAQRYCKNIFSDSHDVTIGGAYLQQTVTLSDGTQVKLHIWDTGGSERFRSMVSLYYRDAAAAIICYDITDEKSFQSVHFWVNEMINNNDKDDFVMVLAGNKCDIETSKRVVTTQMAADLSQKHQMILSETSAKTGEGIQELFKQIAERIAKTKK
ncbi:hypothetical protein FGO68_gene6676 [Halteria grandinella]|uniref:Uncharacterized protein n=1 Tax=Halteria grandinella TaxID=5974 RepID=A0A8J8NIU4_HALGN|nr:hypothetical protein FGO68_gene6676 [Halteria grandinella]